MNSEPRLLMPGDVVIVTPSGERHTKHFLCFDYAVLAVDVLSKDKAYPSGTLLKAFRPGGGFLEARVQ